MAAVVDGNQPGSEITIDGRSAQVFADLGYVEIVTELPKSEKSEVAEGASEVAPASTPEKKPRKPRSSAKKKETNE